MQKKKEFPFRQLLIAAIASLVVLLPVRMYQYFRLLEADTGFYSHINVTVYLVYAVMLFIVIFSFLMSWLNKKQLHVRPDSAGIANGIACVLAALGLVTDAAARFLEYTKVYSSYTVYSNMTLSQYLSENGTSLMLLEAICGLIGGAYFAMIGGAAFSKKDIAPKLKFLALVPTLWAVTRMLSMFKAKISFLNVSELFLQLFATAFLMLFLFYFSVSLSQVDQNASYFKIFAYGWPAAVLLLTCFLPRFILLVIGRSDLICSGYGVSFCDAAIAAFIVISLISRTYADTKTQQ